MVTEYPTNARRWLFCLHQAPYQLANANKLGSTLGLDVCVSEVIFLLSALLKLYSPHVSLTVVLFLLL